MSSSASTQVQESPKSTRAMAAFAENLNMVKAVFEMTSLYRQPIRASFEEVIRAPITRVDLAVDLTKTENVRKVVDQVQANAEQLATHANTVREQTRRLLASFRVVTYWAPVMLVTYTENYLVDVLIEASGYDLRLMNGSEQSASLAEVLTFDSIATLATELRARWARKFVASDGPAVWIRRLEARGVRKIEDGVADSLEQLWGVRHWWFTTQESRRANFFASVHERPESLQLRGVVRLRLEARAGSLGADHDGLSKHSRSTH